MGHRQLAKDEKYDHQKKWIKDTKYGKHWCVGGAFPSIKCTYGKALRSCKMQYMKQEIGLRPAAHNTIPKTWCVFGCL